MRKVTYNVGKEAQKEGETLQAIKEEGSFEAKQRTRWRSEKRGRKSAVGTAELINY